MHENSDPQKNSKIAPKVPPKEAQIWPKIAQILPLADFLGPGTSKMRLREGLQKKNRFLSHSGTLKSGPNLVNSSKNRVSRSPQKCPFWAPFWELFGSPSLHYTPYGGAWGHFWQKKEGPKNNSFFDTHFFAEIVKTRLSKGAQPGFLFGTFFDLVCKILPKLAQSP